ncbi:preprotein translocase subunit SecY [Weeksellaceae bacterium KMM 9713]|uniref:Protein translocase subunit SecY n=1 Tax=Profundicola chukchiensis TaxID=2961959 RepID=A0A9X4RWW2_9FLAO|nr:preprotein translocase subunit SecY [Profundicola chukchiensis]MDG4946272.1 preprotein translocase subunit SecY [Profundicola chukchiensis]MDG4950812.1 preprotein translocase subunit SecY [Profundicola chukchiensis]
MKGFFDTLKNIWAIEELRNKILFTLAMLLVYRFGSYIPLPGIDLSEIDHNVLSARGSGQETGILGLLNAFTGGGFSRASILALGIMPYISASIVIQLMGLALPYLQKLQKEGESGRKKVTQITRYLTIAICLVQAPAYLTSVTNYFLPYSDPAISAAYVINPASFWFWFPSTILLVTGTMFAMWLGEKITDKGIGNGISLLIMIGIMADLPNAFFSEITTQPGIFVLFEVVGFLLCILACVVLVMAVRQVPVQYVGRAQGGSSNFMKTFTNTVRQYIPLKVNAAGVMPIIFAQAIMFLPGVLAGLIYEEGKVPGFFQSLGDPFSLWYSVIFGILVVLFTFFYTAVTIPVNQMAEDLRRNGGIIPRVKPGKDTANFLDDILSKITLPGAIFLALLAILPAIVYKLGVGAGFSYFFGGTSLLILVGVTLDTMQQINTYLLNHHYDGMMQTDRVSKKMA